ncbi:hypothetical protein D5085_00680 [Ectothiorhodospiraceae bacterium BW-2]|nr:hypothetical protein D5085_00680 [Ectothiorhodospiraceae bacterium BW-2]
MDDEGASIKKLVKKDGYIYKYYRKGNLLSSCDIIGNRVDIINNFSYHKYEALINTQIDVDADTYIYKKNI